MSPGAIPYLEPGVLKTRRQCRHRPSKGDFLAAIPVIIRSGRRRALDTPSPGLAEPHQECSCPPGGRYRSERFLQLSTTEYLAPGGFDLMMIIPSLMLWTLPRSSVPVS